MWLAYLENLKRRDSAVITFCLVPLQLIIVTHKNRLSSTFFSYTVHSRVTPQQTNSTESTVKIEVIRCVWFISATL